MLIKSAIVFGFAFLTVGILGFIPGVVTNSMLLGVFHVNPAHNWVHLISGVAALACALVGPSASRAYFQVFGVIYGIVAILGLFVGHGLVLGLIANNGADVVLHIGIAAMALYLGYGLVRESPATAVGV